MTLLLPTDRAEEEKEILRRIGMGERVEHFETVRRTKNGDLLDVSLTISPIRDSSGQIVAASKVARDITAQKQQEMQLERIAYYDPLTGLPNRALLLLRLRAAMALTGRAHFCVPLISAADVSIT